MMYSLCYRNDTVMSQEPTDPDPGPEEGFNPPIPRAPTPIPWLIRPFALTFFSVLPLPVLAITEYLFLSSRAETGLFDPDGGKKRLLFREFIAQFFGLLVIVFLGFFYQAIDSAIKIVEPFYHLSKPGGALGAHSLLVDYVRVPLYFSPFQAIYHFHWAVLCSSLAAILSQNVLPVLALGLFGTDANSEPMHPVYTNAFVGCAAAISTVMFILLAIMSTREWDLKAFPNSIDSYIKLFGDSLREVFNELLDTEGRLQSIKSLETLEERVFAIVPSSADRFSPFEIRQISDKSHETGSPTWIKRMLKWSEVWWDKIKNQSLSVRLSAWMHRQVSDDHPTYFQRLPLSLVTLILVIVFVISDGQSFWASDAKFFAVIGDKRFARSTVSTVVNTLIWVQLSKDATRMEPFYLLRRKGGALRRDISRQAIWPFQDLIYSIRILFQRQTKEGRRDYAMLCILTGTYSANFFVITWNTLALSGETGNPSFWVNFGLHLLFECLMMFAVVVIFLYRSQPFLPLQPVKIASTLLLTHATDIRIQSSIQDQPPQDGRAVTLLEVPWDFGKFAISNGQFRIGVCVHSALTDLADSGSHLPLKRSSNPKTEKPFTKHEMRLKHSFHESYTVSRKRRCSDPGVFIGPGRRAALHRSKSY